MLDTSTEWAAAVTADARRTMIRAIVDITDPDIVYGSVTDNGSVAWSKASEIYDRVSTPANYATLERNIWVLDNTVKLLPTDLNPAGQTAYVSNAISDDDGYFTPTQFVELAFSGVTLLQSCTVDFPDRINYGWALDFTVEIKSNGTTLYSEDYTDNTDATIEIRGFNVANPDAIRVTVTRWSLPGRRMRVCEIIPGTIEYWGNDEIMAATITQETNLAGLALPYGTAQLTFDNSDRRFNPRNKAGMFESIEERQGVTVLLGVDVEGSPVYQPVGTFFQYAMGWHTGDYDMSLTWNLVDIIGLLAQRQYIPPSTLPTTAEEWVASIVGQLGTNFAGRYLIDSTIATRSLTVRAADDVAQINCGQLLNYVCMALSVPDLVYCKADAETGKLSVEVVGNSGTEMTLDNLEEYPIYTANDDVAAIIFTLNDGSGTQYTVGGNDTASGNTLSINNPFIKTSTAARNAAKAILSTYGGNRIETQGRGNPASEIGDVDSVQLNPGNATAGRRIKQSFELQNGVLAGCNSTLLQADGALLYENRAVFTADGSWTVPTGVSSVRLILVGHGGDGTDGTDGTWTRAGVDGTDGSGGKVWTGSASVTAGASVSVTIGDYNTSYGSYTSANGTVYPSGFVDVASGEVYGRSGVTDPQPGSGDGGKGGKGGHQGVRERRPEGGWYYNVNPGKGEPGSAGASGVCVIYWDS